MPFIAKNHDTGEIVITDDADPLANFVCLDCDEMVAYVRKHQREDVDGVVSAFFRYDNCGHLGIDPSESDYTRPGGGGSGESKIHKRRKWTALQVAVNRFDHAQYSTEKHIGSKRADAVLEFAEPHKEYGRGLVIEYQHKNESKDIVQTERHFAEYEYTTLWLWEDQFQSLDGIPEVDLFGGRVCTPWPYAVPKQSEWSGTNEHQFEVEHPATDPDYSRSVEVPATVYKDWVTETPREYWQQHDWNAAFRSPEGQYAESEYRMQAVITNRPTTLSVEATISRHWYWPTTVKYWRDHDWHAAFRYEQTDRPLDAYQGNPNVSIQCNFPTSIVEALVYQQLDLSSLPETPPRNVERGDATEIPAKLTATLADQLPELGKYTCRDCVWIGDDYQVLNDGSSGGTAVCPECSSAIRLNT